MLHPFDLDGLAQHILKQFQLRPAESLACACRGADGAVILDEQVPVARPRYRGHPAVAAVLRALEHAALATGVVRSGSGTATQRIGPTTGLRAVDGILTGVHEPPTSHYQLLRAFADDRTLAAAGRVLEAERYRSHEFGDSMLLLRRLTGGRATSSSAPPGP